jgi:hypothetical protein
VGQCDVVADALRERQPGLAVLMDASREGGKAPSRCGGSGRPNTYMDLPEERWAQIANTDPRERVNEVVERRSDVAGIFSNDDAVIRAVGAVMIETEEAWTVARRYTAVGGLARINDTGAVRMSAVAA